jgi:pre-mRNA-processing factor 40
MQQPAAMQQQQPKSDWTEHTAPDGKRKYYYNSKTQESKWVKPEELMMPEVRCAVPCLAVLC